MIFPSIQNLHPKIIIQKQPETRGIPCFRLLFYSCFLFLLFYLCWILSCPALLRPYSGLTSACPGLIPSLPCPYFWMLFLITPYKSKLRIPNTNITPMTAITDSFLSKCFPSL
ncbi:hypothetical protein CLOBOL_05446 [Enterocloster bolteae ATCC BAA-613]|uniref:Uncharacterized protein n=1 Tax=Enterocloster bolteae (strain ATCC BAA-613 / DSM 15670 / CCUG 46953 / JCM 12243 / WAL 16351) TaxID=411902 RepID=A8RZL6_ENTBW|nr:hypothetical protein CLOBOL_05446 [Enterocloster bolteae ATCC BAA-613]